MRENFKTEYVKMKALLAMAKICFQMFELLRCFYSFCCSYVLIKFVPGIHCRQRKRRIKCSRCFWGNCENWPLPRLHRTTLCIIDYVKIQKVTEICRCSGFHDFISQGQQEVLTSLIKRHPVEPAVEIASGGSPRQIKNKSYCFV